MSKPRTSKQIAAEIAALQALQPVGPFAGKTAASIEIAIDALKGCVDETADEFQSELTDDQQQSALDALNWKNGDTAVKHSSGWGGLVR